MGKKKKRWFGKPSAETRFKVSQAQHKRLMEKYENSKDEAKQFILTNYHSAVMKRQKDLGRILTKQEKEDEYKSVHWYFFN